MDGLIKGMADVILGAGDHQEREDDQRREDDRPRSTWAQVVSGDDDTDKAHHFSQSTGRRHQLASGGRNEAWESAGSNPQRPQRPLKEGGYGRNEEWEPEESRPQRPQRAHKDDEEHNDGWETVGKKPSKHHYEVQKDQWSNYKRPVDQQDYSDEVDLGAALEPSEEELSDLAKAANKLWELDVNRLVPGKDYEIDCGEGKKVYQKEDMAEGSLFTWLSEETFIRRPTYARFCSLLDNYNPHEGCKEVVTAEEREEQRAFMEEISRTAPIKYLHRYLADKGMVTRNFQEFKQVMGSLWFDLYGRGGTSGSSSAFEHVFVGEIKQRGEQEVSGFHNWIQFYLEEAKGRVDYQGYIFPRRRGQTPDSETQLLTIQFEWNGVLKSVSSTLIGVSPEFEIALYTLCFFVGGEDNYVELGPYCVNVKCYRHGDRLGSAFPVAEC